MQAGIVDLAEFAKNLGLSVGIHTNGCYPERAAELIERKLVDKFFIDVKAPLDDPELYGKVEGYESGETDISLQERLRRLLQPSQKLLRLQTPAGWSLNSEQPSSETL